jgi:nucleotide-binding universal stress UspA family protein
MPISTIVVGFDHSARSERALRRANALALYHDAGVVVEHALDVGSSKKIGGLLERVAVDETRQSAQALLGDGAARLDVRAAAGRPFEVLRDVGKECGADLIVTGVHRRDGKPTLLAGSTARRLIGEAPAPVLVVAAEPEKAYEHVLVGYDDSAASRAALRFARALAPGARFTVATACMIPFSARDSEDYLVAQFEEDARRMVTEALGRDAIDLKEANIEIVARAGDAFGVIMEVQRERKADLMVLGTSMPAIFRQVFGGGIVDMIAADPPCDLLVVKT